MRLRIVGRNIFAYSPDYNAYVSFKPAEMFLALYQGQHGLVDTRAKLQTECVVQVEDGE